MKINMNERNILSPEGITVLSLFDGISCGMVALERAGIKVKKYVAYEIDENAINVSMKNYPEIEHCGDVTIADFEQYKGFDLLIDESTLAMRWPKYRSFSFSIIPSKEVPGLISLLLVRGNY